MALMCAFAQQIYLISVTDTVWTLLILSLLKRQPICLKEPVGELNLSRSMDQQMMNYWCILSPPDLSEEGNYRQLEF